MPRLRGLLPSLGGRKRCSLGKACGATCIARQEICAVDLADPVSSSLKKSSDAILSGGVEDKDELRRRIASINSAMMDKLKEINSLNKSGAPEDEIKKKSKELNGLANEKEEVRKRLVAPEPPTGKATVKEPEKPAVRLGGDTYAKLARNQIENWSMKGDIDPSKFDWEAALTSGRQMAVSGEYAKIYGLSRDEVNVPLKRGSYENGIVLKKGEIGDSEAISLRIAGRAGLAPRLLASRLSFELGSTGNDSLFKGLIAMGRLPGKTLQNFYSTPEEDKASNLYWSARAKLHRLGIAHNDAHSNNFMVDGGLESSLILGYS